MFLLEHQAKSLLGKNGVSIPDGRVAATADEAGELARSLAAAELVVKAQIGAGGRGLAGGIKFANSPSDARRHAASMLGSRLSTAQTGIRGEIVKQVSVEERVDVAAMYYIAVLVDQNAAEPVLLGSASGGNDFERIATENPGVVKSITLRELGREDPEAIDGFMATLGLTGDAGKSASRQVLGAIRTFFDNDALLVEINPLAITPRGEAVAIDAKIVIDGNALARHVELEALVTETSIEDSERLAQENNVNYVELDGDIGLVVNGAGLGLATLDLVIESGGNPANFMDIRTTAGSFQIARVIQMLLENSRVKVMLVNVHGGGMTVCDTIAEAMNFAYSRTGSDKPIIYRAAGQNAPWALSIMTNRRLPFTRFDSMTEAVRQAVSVAGGR